MRPMCAKVFLIGCYEIFMVALINSFFDRVTSVYKFPIFTYIWGMSIEKDFLPTLVSSLKWTLETVRSFHF